jgi:glycosyltransferase involved in cell wall biosynthesis
MRVVHFIARLNRGGTALWLKSLIPMMRENGQETFLYCGSVEANEIEDEAFSTLGAIRIKGLGRTVNPFNDFLALLEFRKMLKNVKPDILNTHTAKAGMIGRIASIGLPLKRVHTFHGHLLYGYFSSRKVRVVIWIERILGNMTDGFISVGDRVKKDLISAKIGEESRFFVIHPPIRSNSIAEISKPINYTASSGDQFIVGWLGRLTQIKNPSVILKLAVEFPDIEFLVGGDGEMSQFMRQAAPKNVKFTGWVDPEIFWPKCNIAILTSKNEGLPTSLIEAGYFGIPAIAYDVGSVSEIVIEYVSGFLVSNFDEMKARIEYLSLNPETVTKFGKNARIWIDKEFNSSQFYKLHYKLYSQLVSSKVGEK